MNQHGKPGMTTELQTSRHGATLVLTPSKVTGTNTFVQLGAALAAGDNGSVDWACGSLTTAVATARGMPVNAGTLPAQFAPGECR